MKQFIRFLTVGVFNTVFGYCVIFGCMYVLNMSPESSNVAGYVLGLAVSYILNRKYTFNSKRDRNSEMIRFLTVFAVAYASNFAVLILLIHLLGVHEGLSQILAGLIYVVISYFMNKYYVFSVAKKT